MRNKLKYLMLAILLAVAYGAAGQSYEIDRVCRGAERHYRIDGEAGSVYTWQLTDPLSVVTTLPETADTVTIIWNVPAGTYILTTIQIGINGCDSLQLGSIEVLELPEALAGENMVLCESAPVTLDQATAAYYSSLLWTTTGDGIFDDASIIHPVYTPGPADIAAGSVTLTLTASGLGNDDSCVPAVSSLILTISSLVADNTMTPASCNGTADGEVTLLATGGTEPYLYTLDGTSNSTGIFTGLIAGTYTWIITDASNCELTGDITVTAPDVIAATLNQLNVNCFGASNGSIELINVSGGSGNYEYRINGGLWQTEASFSGLAAGDYLVEVRDALAPDCIVSLGTITITEPAILAANTTHTDETYPGANDGTITVSDATGGSGSYQYSVDGVNWFDSPLFTGLNPADYTVYVRDANATDCYLDIEIITILPGNALTADVSWDNISCFNADDGRIVISNPQNGGGNYEYSIDGGTSWHPGGFFNNLQPGDYAVMLRDADVTANEILLENVTLTQPDELLVSVTGTSPTTPGGTDGTATATVSGGTPAYSYLWDDALAQTTATATGLTAGTYTVIVTDANGCTASESITLTDPLPELAVTIINVQHVSCFGGSDGEATAFVTGGTPDYTYLWDDPLAQTTATATGLAAGDYTVTVTDALGATVSASVTITQPDELLVSVTGTSPTTPGGTDGTATATVSGGTPAYSYLWDDALAQTTATATGLTAGTYTVMVTDANGCTASESITLTDPLPELAVTIINVQHVSCFGGSDGEVTAFVTGGTPDYTYLWDDPLAQTTATATGLAAGDYTVTVTDALGATVSASVTITQPDELLVSVTGTNPTTPGGTDGTATATVSGGTPAYSYLWDDALAQTTATATGLTAGTYTVIVTDANGCTASESITLTDPLPELAVTIINVQHVSCFGGSDGEATAFVTGGTPDYTYLWDDPLAQTTATATGLAAGDYTVTVTDALGATVSASITIKQPDELLVSVTGTSPTTPGGTDGTATATVSGGTPAYSYLWDDALAQTTATATGLTAGTYTVMVTDANGCTASESITLTDPLPELAVTIINVQHVSCFGGSDGEATAFVTGGTPAYTYLWDDPLAQTTATATGLAAGDYNVTITDALGATVSASVTITQPDELLVSVTGTSPTTPGGTDGTATATVSGGTPAYSYLWDDALAQTTATATGLTAGTYTVMVTDANGCTASESITLTDPLPELAVTIINVQHVSCFGGSDGEATAFVTGGTPAYTYLWDDPLAQTTATATGLAAGDYTVTVTDALGATVSASVTITQPDELLVSVTGTSPTTPGGTDGTATATVSGGTPAYSYLWDDALAQTTATATGLTAGTYTVMVTDANGCTASESITLTDPLPELAVTIINVQHVSCFGGSDGEATAFVTGGTPAYTYLWDDPLAQTTATATGLAAGDYTVTVTDALGATVSASITITQPDELLVSVTGTSPTTPGGTDGTATATVSGGTPAYSYLWDDALAQTTATATGLTAGTYTVIVTDANGCTASESITLTDPLPELAVTIINVQHVSCFGGSDGEATAFVTGGMPPYTYLWNDGFAQTSATATGLTPGNYTVIVTDALGATASASVTITQPEQLTVNVIGDNPSAPGGSDGQATATPAGGTPGYTYLWNNGATTQTINGLTSGLYTVTVTDANGCVAEGSVILTEPASQLTVTATVTKQISCFGAADGQLLASAQGGIAPYQYSWNDPATQSGTTAINLAAGSYTVTVTDAVGFTAQATVLLTQPEPLQLIAQALPSICSDDNGSITASATGGTGLYEYSLSGVTGWQTEQLFTGLPAGIYTVLARDENGCTAESQIVEINYLAGPDIIETELTHTTFWLPNGSVVIVASGYATPLQYSITGNTWQGDRVFNDLMAGHYMAYVQDANGCVDSLDFEILNQVDGNVLVSADTVSFCMNVPVTIPVGSRNFTDISSFTLELEFDPAMLAFMDLFMKNPVLDTPNGEFRYQLNGNTLIISFSAYTGSITIPENENLFSIGFEALMPGLANISWNSIQCNIFASGGYQVQEVMVPGQAIIKPAPALYVSGAGEFCEGDTLTLRAASFGGEELSYLWTGPTGHTHLSAEWQLGALGSNDHGHYTVRATNTDECSDEESLDLIVNAKPIIYLGYADTVCYGQPQLLDPGNGFESYLWQDGSTAQTMLAMDPGLYSVVVTNEKGCMAADSVALVPCTIDLLLPNAFTPNSDGLNDVFRPIFRGWEPGSYFMQIYSRWGQLLYETTNPSEGWDGTADGVPLPPGVYAYVIAFEAPSYVTRLVSSPVSGSVTLIR